MLMKNCFSDTVERKSPSDPECPSRTLEASSTMEPDKGAGERLLDIIIEGGNFGKFNVERISEKNKKRSLLGKYIAANIKNIRFIGDYTNEVLWGPYFMLYNWIWRHTR